MKVIGIGGAGGKLAAKMDAEHAILVNVSETELEKVSGGGEHIVAPVQSTAGQFRGSRKDPLIGHDAYNTIRRRMQDIISGSIIFSSTGGGTGNGITTGILEDIIARDESLESSNGIPINEKTMFALVLPDYEQESNYVENSIDFMSNPVANAIDKGSTGNIMLFSNKLKFDDQIGEDAYNQMIVDSLNVFMAIPEKNTNLKLLELHIDHEDFTAYISKPSAISIMIHQRISVLNYQQIGTSCFFPLKSQSKRCSFWKFLLEWIIRFSTRSFHTSKRKKSLLSIASLKIPPCSVPLLRFRSSILASLSN